MADPTPAPAPGFLAGLGRSLYDRVFVAYRSTLVGIALAAAVLAIDYSTDYLKALPAGWAQALSAVLVIVGGLLRSKQVPVAALKVLPIVLALGLAGPALAQDVPPPPPAGPMAVALSPDFSLHLAVSVPAFGYSLTTKQFLGQLTFGLAYIVDYRSLVAVGLGGGYFQTNDTPGAVVTALLGGPVLPWKLSDGVTMRPAGLYQYKWLGGTHENIIAGTLALQF